MLDHRSRLIPVPGVHYAELDGETVLLAPRPSRYYTLDEVGTRIWQLLGPACTLADIHAVLRSEYEVDSDQLWADLQRLAGDLIAAGLVVVCGDDPECR